MENINFELYKIFYFVAKEKSITKASQKLFISQPAVTQSIKKLEEEIGYRLFYRTKYGMDLTEAGNYMYTTLKSPIESILNIKRRLTETLEQENQIIRIGSGNTLVKNNLLQPLKSFKKKFNKVTFEILDGPTKDLFEQMEQDLLDIIIFNMPSPYNHFFPVETLENVQDAFIASCDFKEYKNKIFSFEELNKLPLVLQKSSSSSKRFLETLAKKHRTILTPSYELLTYSLVLDFVKAGLAIGFINKNHIKKELQTGELYELNINFNIPPREIGIAINPKRKDNPILNEFIHYLKK